MGSVFGLNRGLKVSNTGESIKVPVGEKTLGRLYNVLGEEIDELGKTDTKLRRSFTNMHQLSQINPSIRKYLRLESKSSTLLLLLSKEEKSPSLEELE